MPAVRRLDPPEVLRGRIEEFLRNCREPAVYEPGEKAIPLDPAHYDIEVHGGSLVLHAWNTEANLVRRIVRVVRDDARDRMELATRRLARGEGSLVIVDLARAGADLEKKVQRLEFRERLRRMLARQFAGWDISQISASPDLEHSLSPSYTRALLTQGQSGFVVVGADEAADAAVCDHILAFGLIWLDHARTREPKRTIAGLKLYLPRGRTAATANRLAFLNPAVASYELFEFAPDGSVARIDEKNYGNLSTALDPAAPPLDPAAPVDGWIRQLAGSVDLEQIPRADGLLSLRIRGLEFARAGSGAMTYGIEENRPVTPSNFDQVEQLAIRLSAVRNADSLDKQSALYRAAPERWLETLARSAISALDPSLLPEPVYAQVPAVAGADRGILDLLACDRIGRLTILELKASEDIQLPLQGLDYWMRVKWHLDRGEFRARGYFRGIELQPAPPRLLLVSPAFGFHPTTETILRYFSPQVSVERVGLGAEWRKEIKVVFRVHGAERPA